MRFSTVLFAVVAALTQSCTSKAPNPPRLWTRISVTEVIPLGNATPSVCEAVATVYSDRPEVVRVARDSRPPGRLYQAPQLAVRDWPIAIERGSNIGSPPLKFACVVDENGRVQDVRRLDLSVHEVDDLRSVVQRWEFIPASVEGRKIAAVVLLTLELFP